MPKNIFYFVTICTKKHFIHTFCFLCAILTYSVVKKKHLCRFLEKTLARFCLFRCFYVVVRGDRRKKAGSKKNFSGTWKKEVGTLFSQRADYHISKK